MAATEQRLGPEDRNTLPHFAQWCEDWLILDNGRPLTLEPFQKVVLADYFAGVRETLIMLPSSNGKTTLFAGLALYHLIFTPDAMCLIAAASREQAAIMYDHARGFVLRNKRAKVPGFERLVEVRRGTYEIRSRLDMGKIKVLAADANTADGVGPTLALVDELHRHRDDELFAVFLKGLKKRDGQIVTISTAGSDEDSALGRMRKRAFELPEVKRDGTYTYCRGPSRVMHEWSLTPEQDRTDMDVVKSANPAAFVTKKNLEREYAGMEPWNWARFACNVWIAGEDAAISAIDWQECAEPGLVIDDGEAGVWLGIDLGWKWDTTAIVPIQVTAGEPTDIHPPAIIEPPRDGTSTRVHDILDPILDFARRWQLEGVVLDPNADGEQLAQTLEDDHGLTVIAHSQDPAPMSLAAERLSAAIRERQLRHPADPQLTSHALAAAVKFAGGERWRYVKQRKAKKPIDALIALAMVHSVATVPPELPEPGIEVIC